MRDAVCHLKQMRFAANQTQTQSGARQKQEKKTGGQKVYIVTDLQLEARPNTCSLIISNVTDERTANDNRTTAMSTTTTTNGGSSLHLG